MHRSQLRKNKIHIPNFINLIYKNYTSNLTYSFLYIIEMHRGIVEVSTLIGLNFPNKSDNSEVPSFGECLIFVIKNSHELNYHVHSLHKLSSFYLQCIMNCRKRINLYYPINYVLILPLLY